jgi:uncharacterized protein
VRKLLIVLAWASWLMMLPIHATWAALPDPVAFGTAIELGNINAAHRWLDEGLDPNLEADRIGSGLMIAAWEGNLPMMELFVARGADIGMVNRHGEQALQLAAWRGHLAAVRWLLDHGANLDRTGKEWSALHYAVFAGHGEIARLLMERGANINARAPNDATVLMMAAREGREELAKALIDAGADQRLTNDRGDTALTWAMRHGNLRIAKLVSSAELFSQAVQVPPEVFGPPKKSVPAPSEISELLEKLRQAEMTGQPTTALRQALKEAIERFRKESTVLASKGKKRLAAGQRPTLVITASRKGGERVEIVSSEPKKSEPSSAETPARRSWSYDETRLVELTESMRQLDEALQAGRPTAQLRHAVQEAYQRLKAGR